MRSVFFGGLFLALAVSTSDAATIVVKPGTAIPTLTSGQIAASAGDTILVKSGTYVETVLVTKANLTFKAQGKVVLDASDVTGGPGGCGFLVNASGVTIEGFTIRNARTLSTDFGDGIRTSIIADDVTIRKCSIVQSETGGIALGASTGAVIENCVFDGVENGIVAIGTADVVVRKCTVKRAGNSGMIANGTTNVLVEKCKFEKSAKSTLVVFSSADVTVKDCSFRDLAGSALTVFTGSAIHVRKCSMQDGGSEREAGVVIDDVATFTLEKLNVSGFADGIHVFDSTIGSIVDCTIKTCRQDGIDVSDANSTPVAITNCTISACLAEGIDNSGAATQATNCHVTKNRIDVANEGTLGLTNVVFGTGGIATAPQID